MGSRQIARAQAALLEVTGQLAIVDRMASMITEKARQWEAKPNSREPVTILREGAQYNADRVTITEEIRRIFDRLAAIDERLEELKQEQEP